MNNTQVDDAQHIDVVLVMYNLVEYSAAYSKIWGSLWQYYRAAPALNNNGEIAYFTDNNSNNNSSFKFKQQITVQTGNGDAKDTEITVPLKYLSSFWRTLQMPLINYKISLQLKWSKKCVIVAGTVNNQSPIFQITDTKC